jgi:hypothetical protein
VLFIVALTNYAAVFTPFMTMLDYFWPSYTGLKVILTEKGWGAIFRLVVF